MSRIILVGQAPGARKGEPLDGAAGRRLAALAGLDLPQFLERFERVNLIEHHPGKAGRGDAFDLAAARARADELREGWAGRKAVLLGRGVMAAFRLLPDDAAWFQPVEVPPGVEVACMPHPSGISTWWNDPANVEAARRFMGRLNVGFLAPLQRVSKKRAIGRPEVFAVEQVAAALLAADGILTEAAKILADETGKNCERQNVALYCERYPALQELRERCKQQIGDIAEQNVWRAVREGDPEVSLKLLRCKMFAGRGYELTIAGKLQHSGSVEHRHSVDPAIAKLGRDKLEALEGIYSVLSVDAAAENGDMTAGEAAGPAVAR